MKQAFTNYVHEYDRICNMHAYGATRAQKFLHSIDPLCKNNLNLPHRPICFQKIRATTAAAFLPSNTVVSNPYSHSTALDP